eukprot:gene4333-4586_t
MLGGACTAQGACDRGGRLTAKASSAGLAFNQRYINTTCMGDTNLSSDTCISADGDALLYGVAGAQGVGFSNFNLLANSSALDRTIMSANSFFAGTFPSLNNVSNSSYLPNGQQLVPVYSVADSQDWKIRGYTKCPEYQSRLEAWFSSPQFIEKQQESEAFRRSIQQLVPQLNTSLANWWNVYDAFNVWEKYQVGDEMPALGPEQSQEVVDLAMWLETAKMSPSLASNLLGGGLLGDLLNRMAAAEAAVAAGSKVMQQNSLQGQAAAPLLASVRWQSLKLLAALQIGVKLAATNKLQPVKFT